MVNPSDADYEVDLRTLSRSRGHIPAQYCVDLRPRSLVNTSTRKDTATKHLSLSTQPRDVFLDLQQQRF